MSTEVERKVVDMQFNNRQFERNINTSISSLDKLKASLNFNGMGKGLEEVDRAASSVNFSGLTKGVDEVTAKFSYMQIAIATVVQNITNDITNAVKGWTKQLTTANITSGWDKYAEKTSAVQTIMAGVTKEFDTEAEKMAYVSNELDIASLYADETSASMRDMTSSMGKFVAAGADLEETTVAMIGINNWAARSGKTASQASGAYYNLSQAFSKGALKAEDWRSIEGLNMNTREFMQTSIETAEKIGVLKKVEGGWVVTNKALADSTNSLNADLRIFTAGMEGLSDSVSGDIITIDGFRESLSQGWFNKEVQTAVYEKYGQFSKGILELMGAIGEAGKTELTGASLVKSLEEYKDAAEDAAKQEKLLNTLYIQTGVDVEELRKSFDLLTSEEYSLGMQAHKSASEAKTFAEAIDSVKDAASTKWSEVFEMIFGNYLEAREIFTDLSNYLYDLFVTPVSNVLEVFADWKYGITEVADAEEDGGKRAITNQEKLMEAFGNIGKAIVAIKDAIASAFEEVFGSFSSEDLTKFTDRFYELTQKMILSEDASERLTNTLVKILTVIQKVGRVVKTVVGATWKLVSTVAPYVYDFVITVADGIEQLSKSLKSFSAKSGFSDFLNGLRIRGITSLGKGFDGFVGAVAGFAKKIVDLAKNIDWYDVAEKIWDALIKIVEVLKKFWSAVRPLLSNLATFLGWCLEKISNAIQKFREKIQSGEISNDLKALWLNLKKVLGALVKVANAFLENLAKFVGSNTFDNLLDLVRTISVVAIARWLMKGGPIWQIVDIFEEIGNKFATAAKLAAVKNFGAGILMLAGALLILTTLDVDKAEWASKVIVDWVMNMTAAFTILSLLGGGKLNIGSAVAFATMGMLLLSMAAVMKILGRLDETFMEQAKRNMEAAIEFLYIVLIGVGVFATITKRTKKERGIFGSIVSIIAIIGAFMLFAKAAEKVGNLDVNTLESGMTIFVSLLTTVGMFMLLLADRKTVKRGAEGSTYKKKSNNILSSAYAIVLIAGAMWIFAKSLKALDGIDPATMWSGAGAFMVLLSVVGVIGLLINSKSTKTTGGHTKKTTSTASQIFALSGTMLLIAGAMWIFAMALQEFSKVGSDGMINGGLTLVAVLGAVALVTLAITSIYKKSKTGNITKIVDMAATVGSVVVLVAAMWIFARVLKTIDSLTNESTIWKGVAIISALVLAAVGIAFAISLISKKNDAFGKNIMAALAIFLGIGALIGGLIGFAFAVKLLSDVSWEQFGMAMAVISGLGLITVGLIWLCSLIDGKKLLVGLGALTMAIIMVPAFAAGLWLMFKVLEKAPALSDGQMKTGILAIVGVIAGIVAAVAVMAAMRQSFDVVSKIILRLSTSFLVLAAAVKIISSLIEWFSSMSGEQIDNLNNNFKRMAMGIPDLLDTLLIILPGYFTTFIASAAAFITQLLAAILNSIAVSLPQLMDAIDNVTIEIMKALNRLIPLLIDLVIEIVKSLNDHWPEMEPHLVNLFDNLMSFIIKCTPSLVAAVLNIVTEVIRGIRDNLPTWLDDLGEIIIEVVDWVFDFLDKLINSIAGGGSTSNGISIRGSISGLIASIWDSLKSSVQNIFDLGALIGDTLGGLFKALNHEITWTEYFQTIYDDGQILLKHLGIMILTWIQDIFGSNFMGIDIGKKLADLNRDLYAIENREQLKSQAKVQNVLNGALRDYVQVMSTVTAKDKESVQERKLATQALEKELSTLTDVEKKTLKSALESQIANKRDLTAEARKNTQAVVDMINQTLGIHSPSTVFENVGKFCIEGFNRGFASETDETADEAFSLKDTIKDIVSEVFGEDGFTLTLNVDAGELFDTKAWIDDNLTEISPTGSLFGKSDFVKNVGSSFETAKNLMNTERMMNPQAINTDYNNYFSNTFNINGGDENVADVILAKLQNQMDRQTSVWTPVGQK